jgi:signal transduction histidine kinase
MLRTILRNLISNAIKFTRVNGKIEISSTLKDTHIVISVRDTGVGIAPDLVDRIFDLNEFHSSMGTAQEKGNGLGLVICREFVDMQKGKIWVDLSTNEGTKIDFSLPNCNSLPNDETKTDLSPNISATTNQFVW